MRKGFLASILLLCSFLIFAAKDGHDITIKVEGVKNAKGQLAYHYETKKYLEIDSLHFDKKGIVNIKGDKKLQKGIYLLVLPNQSYFELLIGEEQEFYMETDTSDLIKSMVVKESINNELFYGFLQFWGEKQEENKKLKNELSGLKKIEKPKKDEKVRMEEIDKKLSDNGEAIRSYQEKIITSHPKTFYAHILKAMKDPEVPDPPKDNNGNLIDSNFTFKYYKAHYWDNFDFNEDGLVRTPILKGKMDRYLNKMTLQIPDSIIKSADFILSQAPKNSEMMKYFLANLLNEYANSKIMGMDAVYVHLVQNYYDKGTAYWVDDANLKKISDRAKSLSPLLIGKVPPNMVLKDLGGKYVSMHDVASKNKYTVLFLYDSGCGHCKKAAPKLKKGIDTLKAKKIDVEVYAACTEVNDQEWRKFVKDKSITEWINVADIDKHSYFRSQYDITSTPQVYIVDKNKKIIAKRLGAEQVQDFIERYDKSKDGKLGPVQMKEDNPSENQ